MEQIAWNKRRFFITLSLILLLMAMGLGMLYRVFVRYEDIILQNEDKQLYGLARSVNRSVDSYLDRYGENLSYIISRRGFLEAEAVWLATGEAEPLLERMGENLAAADPLNVSLLALREGEVVLSSNGSLDYRIPPQAGFTGPVSVRPCLDSAGTIYLAFLKEADSGVTYASIVDLAGFYQRVAGKLTAGPQDHIMLMDAGGQTLIHRVEQEVRVEMVEDVGDVSGASCDLRALPFLLERQAAGQEGTTFFETASCRSGTPYTARMAVLPAQGDGSGFFTVAVSVNYLEVIRPLRLIALRLLVYGGMVVTGMVLLAGLTVWSGRRNDRQTRELALLREKNEAMEELNRQTQELAHHQRLETIGTLTSSIAHEFNNLLTPIMGYSMLSLEKLPPEEEELYDNILEIYNASRKAKEIISRLSDLSRKNTALTFQYVSPDELAERVLAVAAPVRPQRVEVRTELDCRHVWFRGNETQLSQMLLNLVLNAYQAMPPAGGTLTLHTWSDDTQVCFAVGDTGCGIPQNALPQIFDPFYTTKESGKGTGLGLAIVQQVVEEHGGQITVTSQVGEGTVFTIRFPLTPRETPEDG